MGVAIALVVLAVAVLLASVGWMVYNNYKYGPGGLSITAKGHGDGKAVMHGVGDDHIGIFYSERAYREHNPL